MPFGKKPLDTVNKNRYCPGQNAFYSALYDRMLATCKSRLPPFILNYLRV